MSSLLSLSAAGEGSKPDSEYNLLYVPTPQIVVNRMLEMGDVDGSDVLYDLGCGDGRIVITAAKRYGTEGVGVDLNPERIKESRKNAKEAGVTDRVEFRKMDVFDTDVRNATVVTLYLLPEVMEKLPSKLMDELDPGTRIVSHDFDFPDWEPDRTLRLGGSGDGFGSPDNESDGDNDLYDFNVGQLDLTPKEERHQLGRLTTTHSLYYWVVPAQINGKWAVTFQTKEGKRECRARFKQQFQELSGRIRWAARGNASISKGNISGRRVQFEVNEEVEGEQVTMRFSGRAEQDRIRGTVTMIRADAIEKRQWEASKLSP